MEATVLLKVLEETDRHTLSFDMDDFDFLWHTACAAIYWEPEHEGRFEESMDQEPPTTAPERLEHVLGGRKDQCAHCVQDRLSAGYEAYLLWDTGLNNWCVLTDHGSEILDQIP